jgi:hypothetical protein
MIKTRLKHCQALALALMVMAVTSLVVGGITAYLIYSTASRNKNTAMDKEKVALKTASFDVYESLLKSSDNYLDGSVVSVNVTFSDSAYLKFNANSSNLSLVYKTSYLTYDLTGSYYKAETVLTIGTALSYGSMTLTRI